MKRTCLALILGLTACGGEPDILDAHFVDEVVGAPARSTDITIFDDVTCDVLLSSKPEDIVSLGTPLAQKTAGFPIHPDEGVLDGLPKDAPLTIHIVARDVDGILVGRGCDVVAIPPDGDVNIPIELRALPLCSVDPRFLDLAIVLDTAALPLNFIGGEHLDILKSELVEKLEDGTSYSVFAHGSMEPTQILSPTQDRDAVTAALDGLRDEIGGNLQLFSTIVLATRTLRSQAVCGRTPAILVVEAGADSGDIFAFEDAKIGLFATVGDISDDILLYGIYAGPEAETDLADLAAELSPSKVGLGQGSSESLLRQSLLQAIFAFNGEIVR